MVAQNLLSVFSWWVNHDPDLRVVFFSLIQPCSHANCYIAHNSFCAILQNSQLMFLQYHNLHQVLKGWSHKVWLLNYPVLWGSQQEFRKLLDLTDCEPYWHLLMVLLFAVGKEHKLSSLLALDLLTVLSSFPTWHLKTIRKLNSIGHYHDRYSNC